MAGEGDGRLPELLRAMTEHSYQSSPPWPHLKSGGRYAGFSGPALFHEAAALKRLLTTIDGATVA